MHVLKAQQARTYKTPKMQDACVEGTTGPYPIKRQRCRMHVLKAQQARTL